MDYVDNMEDAEYSSLISLWKFEQHVLYVLYCQNVNQMDDSNIVQSVSLSDGARELFHFPSAFKETKWTPTLCVIKEANASWR